MSEISQKTFDTLESLAIVCPKLKGGYSRSTGGVDVNYVVAEMAAAIVRAQRVFKDQEALVDALFHARERMWEYGFSEDDLQPIRLAISQAEARSPTA